jgi:predicted CoA-binding protein
MHSDDDLRAILAAARRIAVRGAHSDPAKPASYVPSYLHERGYHVLPGQIGAMKGAFVASICRVRR